MAISELAAHAANCRTNMQFCFCVCQSFNWRNAALANIAANCRTNMQFCLCVGQSFNWCNAALAIDRMPDKQPPACIGEHPYLLLASCISAWMAVFCKNSCCSNDGSGSCPCICLCPLPCAFSVLVSCSSHHAGGVRH